MMQQMSRSDLKQNAQSFLAQMSMMLLAKLKRAPDWTRLKQFLAATEAALADAQEQLAGVNARRAAIDNALRDETQRIARFEAELTRLDTEFALIAGQGGGAEEVARLCDVHRGD
jgi:septal ring factor EnvC (AmiA/AmiB activator)